MTKGSIELRGERIERLSTSDMVERGVIQVMEGRHCFAHLTIEENLLTGAYTRSDGKAAVAATLEKVYRYFPRLKHRRGSQAGLHLGRRAADVRDRPGADGATRRWSCSTSRRWAWRRRSSRRCSRSCRT